MIYLASPYNHADPAIRKQRYLQTLEYMRNLVSQGVIVFSPIVHNHFILENMTDEKQRREYAMQLDIGILKNCTQLHILCLEGWEHSGGITKEIEIAIALNIPFVYSETFK